MNLTQWLVRLKYTFREGRFWRVVTPDVREAIVAAPGVNLTNSSQLRILTNK